MANHVSHAALPYPIKHARFTIIVPFLDADGDPTDPTTPDTEFSLDNGAFADTAEEVTTISGSNGCGFITLTGAETNGSLLALAFKVASGPKATLMSLYPRVLPILQAGTAQAGASGTITLASGAAAYDLSGCIVRTTGGTGGGGTGGANNQARVITAYDTSSKVATIEPNWETTPSSDTTYDILITDMAVNALLANIKSIVGVAVSTSTAQLGVNAVNIGGTAQTGRDLGASVLISSGAGTGQLDVTSGVIKANLAQILGTALTETAGQIAAAFKKFFDKATPTGTINSIPDAVAGASGGLLIAGSNAATTVNITGNLTGNVTGSVGSVTGTVTLTNPQGIKKNTALANFTFPMFDSSGDLKTGLTITATRRIDSGAFASCANSASEISSTGFYTIDLASTDLNGDVITFKFDGGGTAKITTITIKTVIS